MPDAKPVTIYTRGVCSLVGTGGYGAVLVCAGRRKELSGSAPDSSNNRMDLLAAVASLRALKFPCQVTLYNTNTYLTDAIGKDWAARWRANGWRNSERRATPHAELWEELLGLCAAHQIAFEYLPFDPDNGEYARCDVLARESALQEGQPEKRVPITTELLEAGKSEHGGWSRQQLACLGVAWPPARGWKEGALGRLIRQADAERFLALKAGREEAVTSPGLFEDSEDRA
jgi:ribonuclease HI